MRTTRIFERNAMAFFGKKKRRTINEGGTSSSKTYSIIQLLITIAAFAQYPLMISIVSESFPHLQRGCIRDFMNIMGNQFEEKRFNKTQHIYQFDKAQIEFFSADMPSKLRGGRRDILYINECNNVSKMAFDELDVRTRIFTFLDFNPVEEFWVHPMVNDPENEYIHSTYLDAKSVLPKSVVDNIESRRERDPNWWNIYGLGKVGNIQGLVHPLFTQIDEMPDGGSGVEVYGLDFGYTNNPSALTRNIIIGDDLFSDQLIYETGLNNQQLANRFVQLGVKKGYDEEFADEAEPKSIDEIALHGFNIKAAPKGSDSVTNGIQKVNQYRQHWTKRSIDCIKEQRNYRYIVDKNGKITNKPIDDWNHGMDSRRYAVVSKDLTCSPEDLLYTSSQHTRDQRAA